MPNIFNQKKHCTLRQNLRNDMPSAEKKLWFYLRKKQLGVKFRRQHGIGKYVVDFFCSERKLVIELDGDSHFSIKTQKYDEIRNLFMKNLGVRVVRFTNQDVLDNCDNVLLCIKKYI
ncbi:endonuclease domain-containing protein [Aliivibrio finisterrensis]|uniref:Endonuclease domain-containing protein n=1 Tax=Aliivibrio finisterrensis TaxID=511998 RepID=A0A6N6RP48_9GAMM|nr:endonuclease domain-containing protein [Aliivibrio finisterrensis]KAB2823217.1 endonuclease domain-containing protein [Aliivibrio finisterrensis]RYU65213.1 endonuclease domain-containing protein [Aliivibrio finisterrensis]RYU68587.1 endonuclease domain-containing protein [Aliivibrio finisterrensis]RYU72022.1 endonuclease domain-containing protein [Aliivibrio finisterrensis]